MGRYFFDVQASDRRVRDAAGMDLPDDGQAIREATLIVWQLLSDAGAEGRAGRVAISIRTEVGACVYEVSTCTGGA